MSSVQRMNHDTIKSIIFCEFHPVAGPKITYQVPEDSVSKELFDAAHVYIITKLEVQNKTISITALGKKIVGCPVVIDNPKYARNALIFNLCFVFDATDDTSPHEPVVKKLASYLIALELENGFLSNEETKATLPGILREIRDQLSQNGSCNIPINDANIIHLKIVKKYVTPPEVTAHQVPIFTVDRHCLVSSQWDLTTQQILPYINGFNHVDRIASVADMEISIVSACIRNLLYYDVVALVSIFQYSNQYAVTPQIHTLTVDKHLQHQCQRYVARAENEFRRVLPKFHDVLMLYCGLTHGTTVRDLCTRYNPHALRVDERKLIQYGLMRGFVRRLHKYPVKLPNEPGSSRHKHLYSWFNGKHSMDEICCETGSTHKDIDERVESDLSIVVCLK